MVLCVFCQGKYGVCGGSKGDPDHQRIYTGGGQLADAYRELRAGRIYRAAYRQFRDGGIKRPDRGAGDFHAGDGMAF